MSEELNLKPSQLVRKVIDETRLTIVHRLLQETKDYDNRFDTEILSLKEVIELVLTTKLDEQFIMDTVDSITVKE